MIDPLKDLPSPATAERRREERLKATGPASLRIEGQRLEGALSDLSEGGSFLTLPKGLEFELEYQHEGVTRTRSVRLVRSQQLAGGRVGWAVEFVD